MTVEIVLLAMVALFVGLRLYSVLGRRTGHEQQPILRPAETARAPEAATPVTEAVSDRPEAPGLAYEDGAASGIRAIISADSECNVVAGTLSDAIPTHDVWTFRRNLASRDPNWLLVETEEAA